MSLFNPERIIRRDDVPEYFVHGARHIEVLAGDTLRLTMCRDQAAEKLGGLQLSYPVAVLNMPMQSYLWNIMAHVQWAFDRGMGLQHPVGPCALTPRRPLMM